MRALAGGAGRAQAKGNPAVKHTAWILALSFATILAITFAVVKVHSDWRKAQFLKDCARESPADFCGKIWDGVK